MIGPVYLVGAGPGDPDLLTVKAARLLQMADVVFHDRLVSDAILELITPTADIIDVGKRPEHEGFDQAAINALLVEAALSGRVVVRLKGGDPLVFGRGFEEATALAAERIATEFVPGLSSALAGPTALGIPVTLRGVSGGFSVVSGRRATGDVDWSRYSTADTLIVLMGVDQRAEIATSLIEAGRERGAASVFIERATTDRQRTVSATLGEVADGEVGVEPPAVWVIGPVADHVVPDLVSAMIFETVR